MAEMHASSNKKYRLKKIRDCWFLENSYTRKTKRLPFLSEKVKINLDDNYIFADNNVYEIKETDSGDTRIEKIDDLVYSSEEQEVDRISESFRDTGINEYEDLVNVSEQKVDVISSMEYSHLHMKDCGQLHRAQREVVATFQVRLDASKLAKLCELRGKMELRINEDGCSFYNTKSKTVKYTFPNSWIRWFGTSGATKFSFEVGRDCPAGEGQIVVNTDDSFNLRSTMKRIWDIHDKR